jgi:hypothetical protein
LHGKRGELYLHLNELHEWIGIIFEITRETVLPCLETLAVNDVEKLVLNKFAEFEIVPFFILGVENFNLVLYLEL